MIFKNKYGEVRSGWAITIGCIITILGLVVGRSLIPENESEVGVLLQMAITAIYSVIVVGGIWFSLKILYKKKVSAIGLVFDKWIHELLHGLLLGIIAIGLVFILLVLFKQVDIVSINYSKVLTFGIIIEIISGFLTAFPEEFLARGYFMTALKTTRNKILIIIIPATLFSLLHLANSGFNIISFINTTLVGLLFAFMFIRTGKLWLSVGFHVSWNFFQGDILGLSVSGGEQISFLSLKLGLNDFLTGGMYGPEGGILVTIILLLVFVYLYFRIKPTDKYWTMINDLPLK